MNREISNKLYIDLLMIKNDKQRVFIDIEKFDQELNFETLGFPIIIL